MWIKRSHVLAPLAGLTSTNSKWQWGPKQDAAFNMAKKIIAREVMLAYPDFNKPFVIHTDASHYQLGAVISQDGKPIAFYSRKLNPAQTRYTTTERELLSIVETLKEYIATSFSANRLKSSPTIRTWPTRHSTPNALCVGGLSSKNVGPNLPTSRAKTTSLLTP